LFRSQTSSFVLPAGLTSLTLTSPYQYDTITIWARIWLEKKILVWKVSLIPRHANFPIRCGKRDENVPTERVAIVIADSVSSVNVRAILRRRLFLRFPSKKSERLSPVSLYRVLSLRRRHVTLITSAKLAVIRTRVNRLR